ncbi:hypothetical protein RchiOBHm_Chr5g0056601 [Rosa chinensis]|uniref:Uncharacterized protein n=1 Tax=Rosa chinensis TaxID=74649 RepID=A0A2P6QGP4_ROSCH|nr:hypothetical protein RchiOBHm_Chr5g0056601 [Rosa chinensis]
MTFDASFFVIHPGVSKLEVRICILCVLETLIEVFMDIVWSYD